MYHGVHHGDRSKHFFPELSGCVRARLWACRNQKDHTCYRRISLCRPCIQKSCFHTSAFDRQKQGHIQTVLNPLRFFHVLCGRSSVISRGAAALAYRRIAPELSSYMGSVFEEICRQYFGKLLLQGRCAVNFSDIGRWWGPRLYRQSKWDGQCNARHLWRYAERLKQPLDCTID